eukprot:s1785_g8.t1
MAKPGVWDILDEGCNTTCHSKIWRECRSKTPGQGFVVERFDSGREHHGVGKALIMTKRCYRFPFNMHCGAMRHSLAGVLDSQELGHDGFVPLLSTLGLVKKMRDATATCYLTDYDASIELCKCEQNGLQCIEIGYMPRGLEIRKKLGRVVRHLRWRSEEYIKRLAHSHWLAIVTMTTVGFGDYVPKTAWGFIIVGVLTMVSTLFLAMPVGILGKEFSNSWERRNYVILISRLRKSLVKLGFGAKDLRILFEYIDIDGDGIISLFEFIQLIHQLHIGFAIGNAVEIFNLFDDNRNGHIDYIEFLRHIFPHESQEDVERTMEVMHESELRVYAAIGRLSDKKSSSHQGSGHLRVVEEKQGEGQ